MAIILLPVCFAALFLSAGIIFSQANKRDLFIYTALLQSLLIVFITELLSAFHQLTFAGFFVSWCIVLGLIATYTFTKKNRAGAFAQACYISVKKTCKSLPLPEKVLLCGPCILLLLVFVQGIIYPPNNWDSLTYHLARIPHWLSQRSLAPYPTHIIRQIYQPPFAEYAILNLDILNHGDTFSASIQFSFFLFLLITIVQTAKKIGLSLYYQLLALFLAATLPEVLLQASSTQNDIVECFFVATAYYFTLKSIKENHFSNYLFLGLSAGLALLTKATGYIYLAPVLLYFGVAILIEIARYKKFLPLWYSIITVLIILTINTPTVLRNYKVSGNIWGTTTGELRSYSNEYVSPALVFSNVVKNAGLHIGIMGTQKPAHAADKVIYKLYSALHININQPGSNYGRSIYTSPLNGTDHEDSAPNFMQLALIIAACIFMGANFFKHKRNYAVTLLFWVIFFEGILFCAYLKWQPWHTRLHIPMFVLGCILTVYAASISRFFKMALSIMLPVIFIYATAIVLQNNIRPYIDMANGKPGIVTMLRPRYENYFNNQPDHYPEYAAITQNIEKSGFKNIGLILSANDFEYPLFTNCFSETINPVNIMVHNYTQSCVSAITQIDCIVSTNTDKPFIDYNGRRYYNNYGTNKFIYLYK